MAAEAPGAAVPSRYRRPRRFFSITGIVLGLILGVAGGLFFTWNVAPIQETDTEPWQLNTDTKDQYVVAVALSYARDNDLAKAINRLIALQLPGDPIQAVADSACRLATTGYVNSSGGLRAIRSMMRFYQLQGRSGCADSLMTSDDGQSGGVVTIDVPTSTPTLTPPPSKTPTPVSIFPTATSVLVLVPTIPPQNDFDLIGVNTNCGSDISGLIIVEVYDVDGSTGLPGQQVRVRWDDGESRFFTGLKPEKNPSYADFVMESGKDYILDMPGHADPLPQPLAAQPCNTPTGERAIISYRVVFRAVG
ncbi:MAG: hypothetical protein ABI835_11935 [Chloroflexota bacterium]